MYIFRLMHSFFFTDSKSLTLGGLLGHILYAIWLRVLRKVEQSLMRVRILRIFYINFKIPRSSNKMIFQYCGIIRIHIIQFSWWYFRVPSPILDESIIIYKELTLTYWSRKLMITSPQTNIYIIHENWPPRI